MKKFPLILLVIIIIILASYFFFTQKKTTYQEIIKPNTPLSYKDATYTIDGDMVTLSNGVSEKETAPSSSSKTITRYFGNELIKDLNADGKDDVVFLLTQTAGGSGTFYYVVAALADANGYRGSHAVLLGDRIAPQTTEKGKGSIIVVNYADRKADEDFSIQPSLGKSIWLLLDPATMQFGEVDKNFEGEADPKKMSLGMKSWIFTKAQYSDGKEISLKKQQLFSLTFSSANNFSATTDCNTLMGKYTVDATKISFTDIAATRKFCEGSQENEFNKLLSEAALYHFTSKGELVLDLKFDSGSATFR